MKNHFNDITSNRASEPYEVISYGMPLVGMGKTDNALLLFYTHMETPKTTNTETTEFESEAVKNLTEKTEAINVSPATLKLLNAVRTLNDAECEVISALSAWYATKHEDMRTTFKHMESMDNHLCRIIGERVFEDFANVSM